ncbi:hypothetical protein ILUMI_22295 [Ignelater luminosus]|uniref:MD-2-related lipid-recognition domain-containing protein n=1 Tax=Ignelater luminosus TaxID=2038154 RepID=A0A8K0CEN6_IGNLU|nr:hypothetical protein ILUMI_22295 [Ignelater luminosus]
MLASRSQFHQDSYNIIHDRLEIAEYNHSAVVDPKVVVFNINDTVQAINGSAYFTPGVYPGVFKFVAKKYRPFPFNITLDICDEYKKDIKVFGLNKAVELSNFKGCPCPVGLYWIHDWVLEADKFPPHIPFGQYKLSVKLYIDDTTFLMIVNWYGSIVPKKSARSKK